MKAVREGRVSFDGGATWHTILFDEFEDDAVICDLIELARPALPPVPPREPLPRTAKSPD